MHTHVSIHMFDSTVIATGKTNHVLSLSDSETTKSEVDMFFHDTDQIDRFIEVLQSLKSQLAIQLASE